MSIFDSLFPVPTGGRNADDMGYPSPVSTQSPAAQAGSLQELTAWLHEREQNCRRIAAEKTGADRDGWLEDAEYFRRAIAAAQAAPASAHGITKEQGEPT